MCVRVFYILIANWIIEVNTWQIDFGDCPLIFKEPCNTKYINFKLSYTRNGELHRQSLDNFHPKLPSDFGVGTEIKIVIHGYGGLKLDTGTTNVTAAYEEKKYNVIAVDWGLLANIPCYPTAFLNTWHVAQCTSILIIGLIANGISLKKIHVVGFSLGAHIAGFTGTQLKETAGLKLSRITGLDPALPFFATLDKHWKLDPGDADFVDVVHTSALAFGKFEASGHIDFYMNGGSKQPFCKDRPYPPLCSHILAGLYFAESILRDQKFVGTKCDFLSPNFILGFCTSNATAIMGEHVNRNSRGIYYVETAEKPPFALGDVNYNYLLYK
ncbi:phospholipase A1-like [Harmonia axyridis]|uniref:phospholipase A1-like n=1 Tax=Harmonia axyridis TaxID=115357 RepID=UPI001E27723C|nr:phospholipase A1-like [Harmonia axyridis]